MTSTDTVLVKVTITHDDENDKILANSKITIDGIKSLEETDKTKIESLIDFFSNKGYKGGRTKKIKARRKKKNRRKTRNRK